MESHLACLIHAREEKKMKWLAFAALLMFVGATFQITSDHYILGAICFVAAASFAYSANLYRKKGNEEKQEEADEK